MSKKRKNFIDIFAEPKDDQKFIINFYLDKEHKFTDLYSPKTKIEDLKKEILLKLSIYSINYKMEYNDHDIGGFDDFTLNQIFLNKTKEEYDIFLTLISTLKKFEGQRVLMTFIQGESDIILYKIMSMKWLKVRPQFSSRIPFQRFPYNSRSCHIMQSNQLVITGGIDNEKAEVIYDSAVIKDWRRFEGAFQICPAQQLFFILEIFRSASYITRKMIYRSFLITVYTDLFPPERSV